MNRDTCSLKYEYNVFIVDSDGIFKTSMRLNVIEPPPTLQPITSHQEMPLHAKARDGRGRAQSAYIEVQLKQQGIHSRNDSRQQPANKVVSTKIHRSSHRYKAAGKPMTKHREGDNDPRSSAKQVPLMNKNTGSVCSGNVSGIHSRTVSLLSNASSAWNTDCLIAADPYTCAVPRPLSRYARGQPASEELTDDLLSQNPFEVLRNLRDSENASEIVDDGGKHRSGKQ